MASLSVSSSSTIVDSRAPPSRQASASASSPSCISFPTLPPPPIQSQSRAAKSIAYCQRIVRNVLTRASTEVGEATATTTEVETTELPEIVKTVQEAWEKVEDKYAIGSLALAGVVALTGSAGMISAIDRLPLVPGVLELVGIGYTGWFTYKNLIFKPDREVLFQKIKNTYKDILGSS